MFADSLEVDAIDRKRLWITVFRFISEDSIGGTYMGTGRF